MKGLLIFFFGGFALVVILQWHDAQQDPYAVGMHWDYSIRCEDGFLWRQRDGHGGTTPVLHTDGTQMRCGEKRH